MSQAPSGPIPSAPSPIRAFVFDWAGTMVDFGCVAPVRALRDAFAAEGVSLSDAEARADMGMAKRDHIAGVLSRAPMVERWRAARGADPAPADIDRLFEAVGPLMAAAARDCAQLIPGAAALAQALSARGVRLGSGTGYSRAMMAGILPRAAEQGYRPEVVVCAGETAAGRPSPLMAWKALVELGAWPARACVKVDDAEVGMQEGREAGLWTIGLAASGNGVGLDLAAFEVLAPLDREAAVARSAEALAAAGADYVVPTVAEIAGLLPELEARVAAGERPGGPARIRL